MKIIHKHRLCATIVSSALAAVASVAQAQAPAAAPAPPPAWKQGLPASMADSKLAPLAGKMTVTEASEIPLDKIKLPAGFRAEIFATGMPGARAMARGDDGKIYIGTRAIGRVYELSADGKSSRVLVDKLVQPAGVAFKTVRFTLWRSIKCFALTVSRRILRWHLSI